MRGDFTTAKVATDSADQATLLLCNPPYVRHHVLTIDEKKRLQLSAFESSNVNLNGRSGLYCYFILLAHKWLASKGIAGWLLPSEFLAADYSLPIRNYLTDHVTLLQIHIFNNDMSLFNDASVGSVAVFYRKSPPEHQNAITVTHGTSLKNPVSRESIGVHQLRLLNTWNLVPRSNGSGDTRTQKPNAEHLKIGQFFEVKRGLATGANKFFIVTETVAVDLKLPRQYLKPVLPSARYLENMEIIDAHPNGDPLVTVPQYVIDCDLSETEIQDRYPPLWQYLKQGKSMRIHERYLCMHRQPWYSQEIRKPAPILCKFMGNRSSPESIPVRFILNRSRALATNAYHLLYPLPWLQQLLEIRGYWRLIELLWNDIKNIPIDHMLAFGRSYGEGMVKFEPRSIAQFPIPSFSDEIMELGLTYGRNASSN